LCGHSMGGHGALVVALRAAPGTYRSVSALAPIAHPSAHGSWGRKAFIGYLGPDEVSWKRYDASVLMHEYRADTPLPILVDVGTADEFLATQLDVDSLVATPHVALALNKRDGYDHR